MSDSETLVASAVAIDGRAVLIEGQPGSGKSSLAMALIDRGAILIGDDGVTLARKGARLIASPPPNTEGLLELRGVGLVTLPTTSAPVALVLNLDVEPERLPDGAGTRDILGLSVPALGFDAREAIPAIRAEQALAIHGSTD